MMQEWQKEQLKVATGVTDGSRKTTQTEALKLALEALDGLSEPYGVLKAQDAIKKVLAQPERKPLTDEQIGDIAALFYPRWQGHEGFARAIEAAHGIKE